jgi:DNA replication and repair protein RecF
MGFSEIQFLHYRNLKDAKISVDAPVIYLIGENGQGKTNFIEGIYYLCFGSSFRTRINDRVIQTDHDHALIKGSYTSSDNLMREVKVNIFKNKKKEIKVDNKIIDDRKKIIQNIPCIVFAHDDMIFVKGAPERKRWFLDQTLSLFEPDFIDLLRDYRKIIKNRNICLREKKRNLIPLYDEKLAEVGVQIQQKRRMLIADFNKTFLFYYRAISGQDIDMRIVYTPSWKGKKETGEVIDFLRERTDYDMEIGSTSTGPHRDSLFYKVGQHNFTLTASTGQLRLISIVLRIAQARYFFEKTKRKPILLIDDVLLELDYTKRVMFYQRITDVEQVFFTFLPDESFITREKGDILKYYIQNGEIGDWTKQEVY